MGGGDGFSSLDGGRVIVDKGNGNLMANDVMDYVARMGTVSVGVEGRIRKLGE